MFPLQSSSEHCCVYCVTLQQELPVSQHWPGVGSLRICMCSFQLMNSILSLDLYLCVAVLFWIPTCISYFVLYVFLVLSSLPKDFRVLEGSWGTTACGSMSRLRVGTQRDGRSARPSPAPRTRIPCVIAMKLLFID